MDVYKMLIEYYDALERLKKNEPLILNKNTKINNDTVALEAGRKRGSIKKSREVFNDLIIEIEKASFKINEPKRIQNDKIRKLNNEKNKYKKLYHDAINREILYLEKINELEKLFNVKNK